MGSTSQGSRTKSPSRLMPQPLALVMPISSSVGMWQDTLGQPGLLYRIWHCRHMCNSSSMHHRLQGQWHQRLE